MTARKPGAAGANSPYAAFKDDSERRRALRSRDVRLVLIALIFVVGNVPSSVWLNVWRYFSGA